MSVIVRGQPNSTAQASPGSLFDRAFEAADQSSWEVVAELINGFSPEHLRYFLATFKGQPDKLSYIYLGAIGNKRVGEESAVALATRVTYLDFSFREQLRQKDWGRAAYFLNAFNRSDILLRLESLNSGTVKAVHEGAVEDSELGEDSGAARVSAEVLAQRAAKGDTRALLLPTIRGGDKDALAKVMRVIDGISPSGNTDRPFTIVVDGQPETLTAAQADAIRSKAARILSENLSRVRIKADYAENRYQTQIEVDKQHWIVAPIVKTLGRVQDPGPDLLAYVVCANREIQSALEAASSHQLEKAATLMADAEAAAISANKMWQAYFEGIINASEMTVTVLEVTRDAAFLTLAVLATVASGGAAAGALGAAEGAGATTTVLGFQVGTTAAANVIATGAPIVANLAEAGAKVSMGDRVDWGALVVDTAMQVIITRFGGKVTGGIAKALVGNPATESLATKVTENLVHTVILHMGSTALTTAARDAYRALKGQNVTWRSFADDLIGRLTDPKGIAVALITTALTSAAGNIALRRSRASSEVEETTATASGAERAEVAKSTTATASADEAAAALRRKTGQVGAEASLEPPPASEPQPVSTGAGRPSGGARGAAEKTPPLTLYRGTVYRFVRGRSRQVHDLGDGVYMTFDSELAVRYAQERRVQVQALERGAPGIVLRVEAEPSELGRVLDFYNNRGLRAEWESFLHHQAGGEFVLRGGPAEMYNAHFENWLWTKGIAPEQFDVIIGPEYIRGGSQVCIRNENIADSLLRKAEEWARAHEPVTPAYPEVLAPKIRPRE